MHKNDLKILIGLVFVIAGNPYGLGGSFCFCKINFLYENMHKTLKIFYI